MRSADAIDRNPRCSTFPNKNIRIGQSICVLPQAREHQRSPCLGLREVLGVLLRVGSTDDPYARNRNCQRVALLPQSERPWKSMGGRATILLFCTTSTHKAGPVRRHRSTCRASKATSAATGLAETAPDHARAGCPAAGYHAVRRGTVGGAQWAAHMVTSSIGLWTVAP